MEFDDQTHLEEKTTLIRIDRRNKKKMTNLNIQMGKMKYNLKEKLRL